MRPSPLPHFGAFLLVLIAAVLSLLALSVLEPPVTAQTTGPELVGTVTKSKIKTKNGIDKLIVKGSLCNTGDQPAIGPFPVSLFLSDDPILDSDDQLVDTVMIDRIEPNACGGNRKGKIKLKGSLDIQGATGRFAIIAIDIEDGIGEINRINNTPAGQIERQFVQRDGCGPETGLVQPLALCTEESQCKQQDATLLSTASSRPLCRTLLDGRPEFNDAPAAVEWIDNDGTSRSSCVFRPEGTSSQSPRPLVLWLHGGEGSADDVYNHTSLREKAESWNLSGNASRPGFILASIHARNIHFPTGNPPGSREGRHEDFYFRDFSTESLNPDVQYYDHLIDSLVAEGVVDPRRIYIMGWSNGGFMAQAYAMSRFGIPTPGGNVVAAAMAFGASDPFNNTTNGQSPSCQLNPYPTSNVPLYLIHRSCDAAAGCNNDQRVTFMTSPGFAVLEWVEVLRTTVENSSVVLQLIDGAGNSTDSCVPVLFCPRRSGLLNHIRWPDGVADGGGIDWEPEMLNFFNDHPHP